MVNIGPATDYRICRKKGAGGALAGSVEWNITVVKVEHGREIEEEQVRGSKVIVHPGTASSLTGFFSLGEDLAPWSFRRLMYESVSGHAEA